MLYWYCSGKWDGEVDWHYQHIECRDACYEYQMRERDCIPFGELREYLSDHGQAWELDYKADVEVLRKKDDLEKVLRDFMAAGIRASRLKPTEIAKYNARHVTRKRAI
jgi:hypothetical protein